MINELERTEIIIVRHGESYGNSLRIMAGHTDVELTARGREQAEATARALASRKIDAIYSSDLSRAIETAEPHARMRELTVILNEGLREIFLGDYEGEKISEITERVDPDFARYWRDGFGEYIFPNGETPILAGERFGKALLGIAKENEGKTILVATHAAVIRAFWGLMLGIGKEELGRQIPFPTNASYSTLTYENGKFYPGEFSKNEHLVEVGFLDTKDKGV